MKRTVFALTALLLALCMVCGCAAQPQSSAPEPAAESAEAAPNPRLSVAVGGEPRTLDPALCSGTLDATYIVQLFEGLTTIASDGRVTAAAARLWTTDVTDYDQPVYTFRLRDDAVWSDGEPVTAADFVYAWERAADPKTEAPYGYLMAVVKNGAAILAGEAEPDTLGVKAVDKTTLEVTLEGPCPYFTQLLTLPVFFPQRSAAVEANPAGWAVSPRTCISNGSFTLALWSHDDLIRMDKNEKHYNAAAQTVEQLTFRMYDDDRAADDALQKYSEIDYLVDGVYPAYIAPESSAESGAESAAQEQRPTQEQAVSAQTDILAESYYFVTNRLSGPTLNYKFGRALMLALDRDALISALGLAGDYQAATGLVPDGMTTAYTKKSFRELAGDVLDGLRGAQEDNRTAARRYLAEAGFADGAAAPELTLITSDSAANVAIATAAAEIWKQTLGVTVHVEALPYDSFLKRRDAGDFDLARGGSSAADCYDPAGILELFCSDYAGNWYSSADYDALMKSAALEESPAVRSLSLIEAERSLIEQGVVIPALFRHSLSYSGAGLTGVVTSGLGIRYFMYAAH